MTSLEELARDKLANLEREAVRALEDPRYKKGYHPHGLPKVESKLGLFDCVTAPCVEKCAVHQDVPEYAWLIAQREYNRALEVILSRNPLPGVTGYVCNHLCQTRCTRNNYDEPVAIRHGLDLLDRVRRSERVELGSGVLVIGGGNSAMDAARTARRTASGSVTVVYRRTCQEMPAIEEEIEEVLTEGVIL